MQKAFTGQSAAVTAIPNTLPGNGTYNAARFTTARQKLADALAAPVFTDEERATAAQNAWACDSLHRLAVWLRNVTKLAVERAVAQAKARTAEQEAEQLADAPTPILEYGTTRLTQARRHVLAALAVGAVFTTAECQRAAEAVALCHDLRRLCRWLRNVKRLRQNREDALWLAHETGFPLYPVSVQRAA